MNRKWTAYATSVSTSLTSSMSSSLSVMRSVHWVVAKIWKMQGFEWEVRRKGELKLGLWKKVFKAKNQRQPYPKRLVLIPGFGDTPLSWYTVVVLLYPVLRQNFDEIILLDFPGFLGFLSKEKSFPSMDQMRITVNDTLDSLKPHTILGHSLGGWLAGHYAAECGAGVRPVSNKLNYSGPKTLILANPSGVYRDEEAKKTIISIFNNSKASGISALRPHLFAREPKFFRFILSDFQNFIKRGDIHTFMESVRDEHVVEESVQQIKAKVWLIWGEKDTLIPAKFSTAWLQCLNAKVKSEHHLVLLPNSGHSPHVEQPVATAAVIAQILSKRTPHRLGKRWWRVDHEEPSSA